jgi:hypothetical protein
LIHGFDGFDVKSKEQLQKEKLEKVASKVNNLRRR